MWKKKDSIYLGLMTIILTASLLVLQPSHKVPKQTDCCKQGISTCPQEKKSPARGISWDGFSQQFFSSIPSLY